MTDLNIKEIRGGAGDDAAFRHAASVAKGNTRVAPHGLASDPLGTTTITLPPGDYTITGLHGLLGAENTTRKSRGLRFIGAGANLTHVIFDPSEAGVFALNQYWQSLRFEGITFSTTKPGSTFMRSLAVDGSAPQDFAFTDVAWNGPWKYIFDLQGTNNNSEFRFVGCATAKMQGDGAWLHAGAENTSDQFLNYWFYACKHQMTDAALVDMARGGHVHIYGLDASAWGNDLTGPRHLINLRGGSHAYGVMSFTAHGLRVEPKNANAALLYSEWPDGNVEIQCDWLSQVNRFTYGDIIHLNIGNEAGPILNVHDSSLAGGVKITYGVNAFQSQQKITFRDTVWKQRLTPSEVVTYDESAAGSNRVRPAVTFENCRGMDNQNPYTEAGASVWDATVGHARGPLVKAGGKRAITVRGIYGNLRDADGALKINLPVGAIITGLTAVSATAVVGSWSAHTTEPTPALIATTDVMSPPFLCGTRGKATITIRAQDVTTASHDAFLAVEGYW